MKITFIKETKKQAVLAVKKFANKIDQFLITKISMSGPFMIFCFGAILLASVSLESLQMIIGLLRLENIYLWVVMALVLSSTSTLVYKSIRQNLPIEFPRVKINTLLMAIIALLSLIIIVLMNELVGVCRIDTLATQLSLKTIFRDLFIFVRATFMIILAGSALPLVARFCKHGFPDMLDPKE